MSAWRRVCLVTPGLDDNSLGRTYSLWLLCRAAGWGTRVLSLAAAADVWDPLRGTDFADACESMPITEPRSDARILQALDESDLIIAIKAIPESLGLVARYLRGRTNVLLDMDDPDVEAATVWLRPGERIRAMRQLRYWQLRRCNYLRRAYPALVSNPILQDMYGGAVVPHVRIDPGKGREQTAGAPVVAFVGTAKPHKGIDVLRAAVSSLAPEGYRLIVTAPAPDDAQAHERWCGFTSLEEGLRLAATADIVAIPSLAGGYARAQFPVKVVDALLAARPIVASDVGPMRWAVGRGALLVPPGDAHALAGALTSLGDPARRSALGAAGRTHALACFTVPAVLPNFLTATEKVLAR